MSTATRPQPTDTDRFEDFRERVSNTFVPLQVERIVLPFGSRPDRPFTGGLRSIELGTMQVTEVSATAHLVRRTPRLIARSDPEYYKLGVQLGGRCLLTQAGRETCLTEGDFTIYDTSRPYSMAFDGPYRQLVVMFPRRLLCLPEDRVRAVTARRVAGDTGFGAMLSLLLRGLADRLPEFDRPADTRLADNIIDLVTTVYADQLGEHGRTAERRPIMATVLAHIERHLDDADLTPARIAASHYISTRYLHKLFHEESTTVAGWIRERRLEHCRRDLRDPLRRDRSIGAIAARWGFADPAHFSRVFRAAYGRSPHEYRSAENIGAATQLPA
ncbi:helix-turn-helix domain-containing protein [Nocardia panacis]|uniref:Helix-turn-helix domain-containing protein n=1 Tax=Nocardia panacis TaxID=2340916 RepID=A0A3A4KVF1_9NOCA|nr:helix-turn-helix domain-containing protein [Nocardia panacis]RJO79220.1 helix-turn-helix domain-containing protein [Nocardia panacis]